METGLEYSYVINNKSILLRFLSNKVQQYRVSESFQLSYKRAFSNSTNKDFVSNLFHHMKLFISYGNYVKLVLCD
jgi:hypothetical protein